MKKIIALSLLLCILIACDSNKNRSTKDVDKENVKDSSFNKLSKQFIDDYLKTFPAFASGQGFHDYDTALIIFNADRLKLENAFAKQWQDSLAKINYEALSDNDKTDYKIIENQLKAIEWYNNVFKSYEWDPSQYNLSGDLFNIMNNKNLTNDIKTILATKKLERIEQFYNTAMDNMVRPTLEHTSLAISQIMGSTEVFKALKDSINKTNNDEAVKTSMLEKVINAENKTAAFVDFLKLMLKDLGKFSEKRRDFRIGKKLFEEKFAFDICASNTAEEIYNKAMKRKKELTKDMHKLSLELWPKYLKQKTIPQDTLETIRLVLNEIAKQHTTPKEFQNTIEKQIPTLAAFVNEKQLLYLDPSKPLKVRKEPDWMGGVAGASISAPGPFDKNAETYYNVGSILNYPSSAAESYLREYNDYTLQILNIHEAIPGHYAQLVYSNQSPSLVKSLFGNGAMIEGWAVYTERMMMEEGYGNNQAELWLMYYKWHLRTVCNTILDYSLHTLNWEKEQAINLLQKEAFQEKAEAEGKYKRATLSQVQLCSYFTGYSEIFDLRSELKQKQATNFNLKKFHEQFLSYGSAPVKYIKELMIQQQEKAKP
jgi:uncharacterized protein (DUF885 family)